MHRPVPSITYLTLALSFSMRLKFILNIPAQKESGVCTCIAFVYKGFPFVVRRCRNGVSRGYTTRFLPWFPPILQSEQVDASWGKSEPVCRLLLTDSTEIPVVYYRHRLRFFSFSLWFYPVGGYQTCLIFSADFRTLIVLICHVSPSNKVHVSAWVRCDRNNFKVW